MMLSTSVRGAVVGFCVAAPVGPIGLLCIQKTLTRGRRHGFIAGLALLRRSSLRADDGRKAGSFRSFAKKRVEEFAAASAA